MADVSDAKLEQAIPIFYPFPVKIAGHENKI
jgi:hypothetical protein